jgi:hypothetical protein
MAGILEEIAVITQGNPQSPISRVSKRIVREGRRLTDIVFKILDVYVSVQKLQNFYIIMPSPVSLVFE